MTYNSTHFLPYSPEVVTTVTSVCVGRNQTTLGKPPSALRLLAKAGTLTKAEIRLLILVILFRHAKALLGKQEREMAIPSQPAAYQQILLEIIIKVVDHKYLQIIIKGLLDPKFRLLSMNGLITRACSVALYELNVQESL